MYTWERERERERGTCCSWPEKGKGCMVAESTSPAGRGTAGLLFMNGMPPPLSGANAGAAASRGRNGQGNGGDDIDDTSPTEEGADAAT